MGTRSLKVRCERTRMSMLRFLEEKQTADKERVKRNKTIVTLYKSGLLSYQSIAEIMGVSIKTVHRAVREVAKPCSLTAKPET